MTLAISPLTIPSANLSAFLEEITPVLAHLAVVSGAKHMIAAHVEFEQNRFDPNSRSLHVIEM